MNEMLKAAWAQSCSSSIVPSFKDAAIVLPVMAPRNSLEISAMVSSIRVVMDSHSFEQKGRVDSTRPS
jgi:hypothetical protein